VCFDHGFPKAVEITSIRGVDGKHALTITAHSITAATIPARIIHFFFIVIFAPFYAASKVPHKAARRYRFVKAFIRKFTLALPN